MRQTLLFRQRNTILKKYYCLLAHSDPYIKEEAHCVTVVDRLRHHPIFLRPPCLYRYLHILRDQRLVHAELPTKAWYVNMPRTYDMCHKTSSLYHVYTSTGEAWYLAAIHYFLSLFPVFTLSTNFPIIAITLRNNLKALFLTEGRMYSWCTRSCIFPLLALVPPVAVAFVTNSLEFLVGITGSYAGRSLRPLSYRVRCDHRYPFVPGAGIQYVVPAFLVYASRRRTREAIGVGVKNQVRSKIERPAANFSTFMFLPAWILLPPFMLGRIRQCLGRGLHRPRHVEPHRRSSQTMTMSEEVQLHCDLDNMTS